jgi:flavin-dependent dehydrogenase
MSLAPAGTWDVLILGAGPAGCATALGLMAAGIERVLLVDRPLALPFRIGESATPDVAGLLAEFGLDKRLGQMGHTPYHGNLSLWGGPSPSLEHFLRRGQGHGWHLDRAAFDAWLRQEAVARGACLASPSRIDAIVPAGDGWRASVRGMGEISARVAVDAGGRRSPLAGRLGIKRRQIDTLLALATHMAGGAANAGLSWVESFPHGWWYAAGLPDGRTLVALMTDRDIAAAEGFHEPQQFLQAWRRTRLLAEHAKPPDDLPPIQAFAAHSGFLQRAAGSRWIAVGDALMGFDPLTSSGISGALNDAVAAVPAILQQLNGCNELAQAYAERANATFKRYLAERQRYYAIERRWSGQAFWARRIG